MLRKATAGIAVVIGTVGVLAGTAYGHADIGITGPKGVDGIVPVALEVPNERTEAGTVKIDLVFPEVPVIATAAPGTVTGWTATADDSGGSVRRITWTGGPATGETRVELPLGLGPIPTGTQQIQFKVLQTYDDGQVVRWIQTTSPGGEEPEHPAPVLAVTADATTAVSPDSTSTTGPPRATTTLAPDVDNASEDSSDDDGDMTVYIVGAIAAAITGALLVVVIVRHRRKLSARSPE